jgi:hypothetical protein
MLKETHLSGYGHLSNVILNQEYILYVLVEHSGCVMTNHRSLFSAVTGYRMDVGGSISDVDKVFLFASTARPAPALSLSPILCERPSFFTHTQNIWLNLQFYR